MIVFARWEGKTAGKSRADWIVLPPLAGRIGEIKINVPASVILTDKQFVIELKAPGIRAGDYKPVVLDN